MDIVKQKWFLPGAILLLLLVAPMFRWEYVATKSINPAYVLKWKVDRWTSQQWFVDYSPTEVFERPLGTNSSTAWEDRNNANRLRQTFIIITLFWFFVRVWLNPWREKNREKTAKNFDKLNPM